MSATGAQPAPDWPIRKGCRALPQAPEIRQFLRALMRTNAQERVRWKRQDRALKIRYKHARRGLREANQRMAREWRKEYELVELECRAEELFAREVISPSQVERIRGYLEEIRRAT